jgi:hypothetical protein
MPVKTKNILSLNSQEVIDFLMQSEQYHSFELPEYFVFDEILDYVRKTIGDKPYHECIQDGVTLDSILDVNIDILLNKDGRYAVRPLILCNPFLYYFFVRELCGGGNWEKIVDNFKKCTVPHISSCAIPVVADKKEKFHKSTTILNWWNTVEQRSIELSLEYRYMFVSDITNCYGTINPQALDWALSRKNTSIPTDDNHNIALNLMQYLRDFQQGKNVGVPQGSTLFDLTGEIILSYSDLLLSESLEREGISDGYEIIRYRDDYRLFCNDRDMLEKISYILQQVLESLNFRLNSQKTFISDSIIIDSIKQDKLAYIYNTPIFNKKGCDFDGIQKHLLYILMFARKYPNSGQVRTMLNDIDERIVEKLKPVKRKVLTVSLEKDGKEENMEVESPGKLCENIKAMSAICTQIALENVSVAHYALRVISRMTDSIKDIDYRNEIIDKVCRKLINQPNSTYNKLWLQNMTYLQDVQNNASPYDIRLCKVVMGEKVQLWNNSWLKDDLIRNFPQDSVVNKEVLAKVTPIITFRETRAYNEAIEMDFGIPNDAFGEY